MSTESIDLSVDDSRYPARLRIPDETNGAAIVVLPGAGHGPYGDIFDRFTDEAAESGFHVLRFRSWQNHDELGQKTLHDLHSELAAAVELVRARGCTRLDVVAKSLGGAVALTHVPEIVSQVVLWAPAIKAGDSQNVESMRTTPLDELFPDDPLEIDGPTLESISTPVRILHGDRDDISIENSRNLVDDLQNAELIAIEGADHSFAGDDVQAETIEYTLDFLAPGA